MIYHKLDHHMTGKGTYTYCASDRLIDMDVEVGSVLSSPVPGGFINTISLTYATGGSENNFVIHLGAPC